MASTGTDQPQPIRPGRPMDEPVHLASRALLASGIILGPAAVAVLRLFPEVVERYYARVLWPPVGRALARASSLAPISLAEALLLTALLWAVAGTAHAAFHIVRRKRRLANALACGALRTAALLGVLSGLHYALWGLNYARPDLSHRWGWDDPATAGSDVEELASVCAGLVRATNHAYDEVHAPGSPAPSYAELDAALETAFARVARRFPAGATFAVARGPAKPLALSAVLSRLNLAGFYSSITGEANFNIEAPACQLPAAVAHEKAHQRGIAAEDEASFVGFLACSLSDEPLVLYSGYLYAQQRLLGELAAVNPERAQALAESRSPGVQHDVEAANAFWASRLGGASALADIINDAYLRSSGVDAGVASYLDSAGLLILLARHNGGSCIITPSYPPANEYVTHDTPLIARAEPRGSSSAREAL